MCGLARTRVSWCVPMPLSACNARVVPLTLGVQTAGWYGRRMDEDGIPDVLKTERMGHELQGMHGVHGHVSPAMRTNLNAARQDRWETSLSERAKLSTRSTVPALNNLLDNRDAAITIARSTKAKRRDALKEFSPILLNPGR
jgi:hypothetical protein